MDELSVIELYNQELATYIEGVQKGLPAFLAEHYLPYEPLFEMAHRYYFFMNLASDKITLYGKQEEPIILFYQITSYLDGIVACLRSGQQSSAYIILRAIFESKIILSLLMEADTELRCGLYRNYEKVGRWKNLERLKAHNPVQYGELSEDEINRIKAEYDAVKGDYNPKQSRDTFAWAWKIGTPSLRSACEKLNKLPEYQNLYSALSVVAHGVAPSYKTITANNGMITPAPKYDEKTYNVMMLALSLCHDALQQLEKYMDQSTYRDLHLYSLEFVANFSNVAGVPSSDQPSSP